MMQMINMLFLKIVERSLTAGIVIAVVLSVRMLIRRLPKSFAYALWLVVAFRLGQRNRRKRTTSLWICRTKSARQSRFSRILKMQRSSSLWVRITVMC